MPGTPRKDVFDPETVGVYHCYSRCVQRAYLCGFDRLTGKDYSYRKDWIRDRLKELAGAMAIDVLDYCVLDNHLHVILRNRPDIVETWSAKEVVERWWHLCPQRRNSDHSPAEPTKLELKTMRSDPEMVREYRARLSDISWLMRLLCQPIARRANKESQVTGRFFAHRFDCERIVDEAGLLACSMYVALNPIRAGMAETPETSVYTSTFDRIQGHFQRTHREMGKPADAVPPKWDQDSWLAPIFLDERSELCGAADRESQDSRLGNPFPSPRVSNKGFLPMTFAEHLDLVEWTGRQLRSDKRGAIPADLAPILDRLQINPDQWIHTVQNFSRLFRTAVGRVDAMREQAARMGRQWLYGTRNCATAFT